MMDSKPATPLSEQSDKTKKYDRQLRLWGDHGQALLEASHVCICGPSAAAAGEAGGRGGMLGSSGVLGAEVLRSLVLPGIGNITVVDNALVTEADCGNNLFVSGESVGKLRGEELLECLLEMNPDVRGCFVEQSVEGLLASQPHFFTSFSLVVAVNLNDRPLVQLSELLWRSDTPLVAVRSYGMIGYIRLQVQEQRIIETHPDNELPDLRLLAPFPALKQHMDAITLHMDELNNQAHSHIPYSIVLYSFLNKWSNSHDGRMPATYKERKELAQMIRDGMRRKTAADFEENFEEASKAVNTCLKDPTLIPSSLQHLFTQIPSPLTPDTLAFWLVVAGLREFVNNKHYLPVTGVLPDMTADSAAYINLQNIYRDQAAQDAECVLRHALDMSQQVDDSLATCELDGRSAGGGGSGGSSGSGGSGAVTEALVKLMCRNAANLTVYKGKSIAQEYKEKVDVGGSEAEVVENSVVWYVLLRAVDLFHSEFHCYPGFRANQVELDIGRLKVCVNRLLSEWGGAGGGGGGGGCGAIIKDDYIHEMCKYGAAQVHSVAAYVGGCAAHEIIKLLTGQYVTVNNTFLYNAATATTTTLTL